MMNTTHPSPRPKRLRRFTGNEAQARTLIAQRALEIDVPLAGDTWRVSLVPVLEPSLAESANWHIDALWAGAQLRVAVPSSVAQTWIRASFPDLDLPALPPPYVTAALDSALREIITAVAALGRGPVQLDDVDMSAPAENTMLAHHFLLTLARNGQIIHGGLSTDSLGLMLVAGVVAQRATAHNGLDEDSLPVRLRAEIGRTALSAEALEHLALHDTILMDNSWVGQGGELWLGQNTFGVRVRCEDALLTVTQAFSEIGFAMPQTEPDGRADSTLSTTSTNDFPIPVANIPVQVSFDLGERTLTLGELKSLQPGQVLDLGRPLSSAVNIRANGMLIGHGELIEVDGRLGVTLTNLAE